jgi:hypothetical protein
VDALREVADEYEFLEDIGAIWSVGGSSSEWIARIFDAEHTEELSRTAYLSANAHARFVLDEKRQQTDPTKHLSYKTLRLIPTVDINQVGKVEYLFEYERWGESGPLGHKAGMTPPRYVTDRAVKIGRQEDYDRLVLHYFQPHSPWVSDALEAGRDLKRYEQDWWGYLTETGDRATVWNAYLNDLRYVLDDIKLLLDNIDAPKVIISADHGVAFGEYGVLGHKIGSLHPKVRRVPLAVTGAEDAETYEPPVTPPGRPKCPLRRSRSS